MDVAILLQADGVASLPLLVGDLVQSFRGISGWHLHAYQGDVPPDLASDIIHQLGPVSPAMAACRHGRRVATFGGDAGAPSIAEQQIRHALLHAAPPCSSGPPWPSRTQVTFLADAPVDDIVGAVMQELPARYTPCTPGLHTTTTRLAEILCRSAAAIIVDRSECAHYWAALALAAGAPLVTPRTPWFQQTHHESLALRLVRPDDPDHLAACVRGLIANEMGAEEKILRGQAWAARHPWAAAAQAMAEVYGGAAADGEMP